MNSRLFEENINKHGTVMKIIRYGNSHDVDIEFENGYICKNTTYANFKNKTLKSPKCKTVYNIGYLDGAIPIENKIAYMHWKNMMVRCYDVNYKNKKHKYINCIVDSEWHSFNNFLNWFNENFYNIYNEVMHLDKDVLGDSLIYSKNNCIFLPQRLNILFQNEYLKKSNLPKGISINNKKYRVRVNNYTSINVGNYKDINEAISNYNIVKENVIKTEVEKYKKLLPYKIYNILINYKIKEDLWITQN